MKKNDYPSKKTVNLVTGKTTKTPGQVISMFVLYLVLLGIFVRFGVMGPLKAMTDSRAGVRQSRAELSACQIANEDYERIKEEYDQYFSEYLTETEQGFPDRSPVLELIDSVNTEDLILKQISIHDADCRMVVTAGSVSELSKLAEHLEDSPLIEDTAVSFNMAKEVEAVITIRLAGGGPYGE